MDFIIIIIIIITHKYLYSDSLPPDSDVAASFSKCTVNWRAPSELAQTKNVCTCVHDGTACVCHCQENEKQSTVTT